MKLSEQMSYLRGLVDGLDVDMTTKEGKVLGQMMEVLQSTVLYIDDLQNQVDELTELCEDLDKDLGEVEEFLLDEDEDLDLDEYEEYGFDEDEEVYETVCPTCENTIVLADSVLDEGSVNCPCCGELLEFDFDDIVIDDFEESEDEE
ncbi:MAG: hypothetical protein K2H01_10500 [Ruminococcus sp.]|nr:hypothetical protein [Ruminococcus sp.]